MAVKRRSREGRIKSGSWNNNKKEKKKQSGEEPQTREVGAAFLWRLSPQKLRSRFLSQLSSSSSSSSSSSNHSSAGSAHYFVASGDEDGSPIIWDARNGNIVQRLTQHKSTVLMVEQWRSKEDQADTWLATISSDHLRLHQQKFR